MAPTLEYVAINLVQQRIILPKRPCKRRPTIHHLTVMFSTQKRGLFLSWILPRNKPQVVVHSEIAELQRVADD